MNAAQLEQAFTANRTAVLGVAAAGVTGLALYRRKKAAGTSAGDASAAPAYSAGGQTAGTTGGAAYDSSASDLYGAIQPALESIGGQLSQLLNGATPSPVPVPKPVAKPTPVAAKPVAAKPVAAKPVAAKPVAAKPAAPKPAPAPKPAAHLPAPKPPQPVAPHHAVDTWVTVKKGDTLSGIAARFPQKNITAASIGHANGVANLNLIRPGQRFHVVG